MCVYVCVCLSAYLSVRSYVCMCARVSAYIYLYMYTYKSNPKFPLANPDS